MRLDGSLPKSTRMDASRRQFTKEHAVGLTSDATRRQFTEEHADGCDSNGSLPESTRMERLLV